MMSPILTPALSAACRLENLGHANAALTLHAQRLGDVGSQNLGQPSSDQGLAAMRRAILVLFLADFYHRQELFRIAFD